MQTKYWGRRKRRNGKHGTGKLGKKNYATVENLNELNRKKTAYSKSVASLSWS